MTTAIHARMNAIIVGNHATSARFTRCGRKSHRAEFVLICRSGWNLARPFGGGRLSRGGSAGLK